MSMSAQHHFAPGDQGDRDLYARERVLNSAIISADIGRVGKNISRFSTHSTPMKSR
jgi:hypothetical protein